MSEAPWATTTTRNTDTIDDPPDLQPTGLVHRPQQGGGEGYGELAALAEGKGPRNPRVLIRDAQQLGQLLGARGFYSWRQGGKIIEGPTIQLMDALAVMWGRIVSSVRIVDERPEQVHLRGRVLDLLTLTAIERDHVQAVRPAPAKFAKSPEERSRWYAMQLQSASSKAIRGTLEHALPAYLVDAAMRAAKAADSGALLGGKSLEQAAHAAASHLEGKYGIQRTALEAWLESPFELWTTHQLATLRDLCKALDSGDITVAEVAAGMQDAPKAPAAPKAPEAPKDRLADVRPKAPAKAPEPEPEPEPEPAPPAAPVSDGAADGGGAPPVDDPGPSEDPAPVNPEKDPPNDEQREAYLAAMADARKELGEKRYQAARAASGVRTIRKSSPIARWNQLAKALNDALEGDVDDEKTPETVADLQIECADLEASVRKHQGGIAAVNAAREASGCPQIDGAPHGALTKYRDALLDTVDDLIAAGGAS